MSTPSPNPSISLLDYDDDERASLLDDGDEIIIGNDVSLALLNDDDVDNGVADGALGANMEANPKKDDSEMTPDAEAAPDALAVAVAAIKEIDNAPNENFEAGIEVITGAVPEPIVITISDSSDDESSTDDTPKDYANYVNASPTMSHLITVKGEGSGSLGVSKKPNFKKPKPSKLINLAAAAYQFNAEIEHDFEILPCFHFNFHEQGCNREPNCIHGNYIKTRLHCCFDCFEVASAIAFHRRNDPKCPLSKNLI